MRHSSIGVEFAAAVAGFTLLGWWIDGHYGTGPWGLVVGAALGLVGGMYNLIREATQAFQEADQDDRDRQDDRGRRDDRDQDDGNDGTDG